MFAGSAAVRMYGAGSNLDSLEVLTSGSLIQGSTFSPNFKTLQNMRFPRREEKCRYPDNLRRQDLLLTIVETL
jgi:hypothetical protein